MLVAAAMLAIAAPTSAQTFTLVTAERSFGRFDFVLAVADWNGDGRDDVLAGGREEYTFEGRARDRFTKATLRVFLGSRSGRLRPAPGRFVQGAIRARDPIAVTDDFNGDGRPDLAVFDAGTYVGAENVGYGNPPQLFLSHPSGRLRRSHALARAVRREHRRRPEPWYSGPADLHLKSAASGDIDGDGDVDLLWVESGGGQNIEGHFLVNRGDGTFTVDRDRAPGEVRQNWPDEYWGFDGSHFVDIDRDGDLDLALGQIRDTGPKVVNQFNVVLVNDGAGRYPSRIELPHARFFRGFTAVPALASYDVNGDGFEDLLLAHTRNNDVDPRALPFTGRYIQVLMNRRGESFSDETRTWIGPQNRERRQRWQGEALANMAWPVLRDVDRDGCEDLVMSRTAQEVGPEAPLVYRNNGRGQFRALPAARFTGGERYFGLYAVPADVNGDGVVDFVIPQRHDGPDGRPRTEDDHTIFMTLLNTTPPRPVRCG